MADGKIGEEMQWQNQEERLGLQGLQPLLEIGKKKEREERKEE